MSILVDVNGTLTYTVDHTSDNTPSTIPQVWFATVSMDGLTVDAEGNIVAPVAAVRIRFSAYTSGTAEITILQSAIR